MNRRLIKLKNRMWRLFKNSVPTYAINEDANTFLQTTCCDTGFHYDNRMQVHRCNGCERWLCADNCCMKHQEIKQ